MNDTEHNDVSETVTEPETDETETTEAVEEKPTAPMHAHYFCRECGKTFTALPDADCVSCGNPANYERATNE